MVSYFNLMIATDLCFAITPVDARHRPRPYGPRLTRAPACRWPRPHTDDRYRAVNPSLLPGGELFRHNRRADPVPPQGPSVSPASRTGEQGVDP
jgi:hypothetical protein